MRYARCLLAPLAALGVLAACGGEDEPVASGGGTTAPGGAPLAEEYLAVEVTEAGEPRALVAGTSITLRFDGDQLGASAGCNMLGARHELDDGRLVVEELSMTEMGCAPERHAQDEWFAGLLQARPTLAVDGDVLTLTSGETVVRLVDREVAEPDRELRGAAWEVGGFADGQDPDDAAMAFAVEQPGTVQFEEDGFVTGHDGCNGFGRGASDADAQTGLRYEVAGDVIEFTGEAPSTLAACPDHPAEYVERFWAVLDGTVTWAIDGEILTLVGEDGRVVTFRSAD